MRMAEFVNGLSQIFLSIFLLTFTRVSIQNTKIEPLRERILKI